MRVDLDCLATIVFPALPIVAEQLATNERVLLNILSEKKDESGTISILVAAGNCCREENSDVFNYDSLKAMANPIARDHRSS